MRKNLFMRIEKVFIIFFRKNLKFIIPVQLALGVLGLELFGILVFGHATLIELLGLFST